VRRLNLKPSSLDGLPVPGLNWQRVKPWATLGVAVITVATLATAVLSPVRVIPALAITIEGDRSVACPIGDSAFGETKVAAVASSDLRFASLGGDPGEPTTRIELTDPAAPVVIWGDQSLGAISTAVQQNKLVAQICGSPVATAWWDGVWSTDIQNSALILTNTDPTEAIVSVGLIGDTGPIEAAGLRQIEIQRYSTRVVSFSTFGIATESPFAVVLRSDRGRVAALLRSQGDLGEDWRASSAPPATDLVIPGQPAGQGERYLFVTNHGSARASVDVLGLGTGPAVPLAGEAEIAGGTEAEGALSVAAQTTTRIDVSQALSSGLVGLQLHADQPITATLVATTGSDMAGIGAQSGLAGGLVVPVLQGTTLVVTNPGSQAVTVTVEPRSADGVGLGPVEVAVGPGTQEISLPSGGSQVALTADGPDLRAALVVTRIGETDGLAIAPLGSGGAVGLNVALGYDPALG
jgi:hypothetical protein